MQIPAAHIEPNLQAADRFEAIRKLVALLVRAGSLAPNSAEGVLDAVFARERTMSTGIGFGVALPHGATDLISEPLLAFGHAPAGIPFAAIDGAAVRYVFLSIVPCRDFPRHLRCLSFVSRAMSCAKEISPSSTAEEISEMFNRAGSNTGFIDEDTPQPEDEKPRFLLPPGCKDLYDALQFQQNRESEADSEEEPALDFEAPPDKPPSHEPETPSVNLPSSVTLPDPVIVRDLASVLHLPPHLILGHLLKMNIVVNVNSPVDFTLASELCAHFGVHAIKRA